MSRLLVSAVRLRRVVPHLLAVALVAIVATVGVSLSGSVSAAGEGYQALTPARILDTRDSRAVGGGSSIDVKVTGRVGVPARGVGAVVLNVTAAGATAASHVTVWPTGERRPEASSLNVTPGPAVPNLVIATVGADGMVSLYNHAGSTHLIADVTGWFPTAKPGRTAGTLYFTTEVDTYRLDLADPNPPAHQYELPVVANENATSINLAQREVVWDEWDCGLCGHEVVVQGLDDGEPIATFGWPDEVDDEDADTSPDGRYVAAFTWVNDPSGGTPSKLTIMNRATEQVVRTLIAPNLASWAWTPDSELIFVVPIVDDDYTEPTSYRFLRMSAASIAGDGLATKLFEVDVIDDQFEVPVLWDVSHDGAELAYTYGRRLFVAATARDAIPHQITNGPYFHGEAVFSPDGRQVAFVNKAVYTGEINVIPNHRHAPITIPSSGGAHVLTVGSGNDAFSVGAVERVLAWES